MEKDRKGKTIIIAILCVALVIMSVGYATMTANLKIGGEAKISSTWNVRIQSIVKKESSNGVTELSSPQAFSTNASFNVELKEPGDYAIYTVTVINAGSIDAVLQGINEIEQADGTGAIKYSYTSESAVDAELNASDTHTFDVKVEYLSTAIGDNAPSPNASKSYTLALDYGQAAA